MFYSVDKNDDGRLYVLEMYVDGMDRPVYKVGKSSGKSSKNRMLDIVGSYFDKYRRTCVISIKRDRPCAEVFSKETAMHRFFSEYRYESSKPFSGSSEIFDAPLELILEAYDKVVKGELHGVLCK